jgi:hypothetical protein
MSMVGPLRGDAGYPGALTTYLEDIGGGLPGGDVRDPGASTTNLEDVDDGSPGRRCRSPGSAHHLS